MAADHGAEEKHGQRSKLNSSTNHPIAKPIHFHTNFVLDFYQRSLGSLGDFARLH
jgi:hypothetical protein